MRDNRVKRLMAAGKPALGVSATITDPWATEVLGAADFDFVLIDAEHGPIALDQLQMMMIALGRSESTVLVRPVANDAAVIKQILDAGAEGIIVPEITDAESCRAAVRAAKYPPEGIRGFGPRRASRLHGAPRADYIARANDEIAVIVMIESAEAVQNIDEILATPGLDGIMVGSADLAVSMGYLHDQGNAAVGEAVEQVRSACEKAGFPFGIYAVAEAAARKWVGAGALLVTIGSDAQFIDAGVARIRKLAEELKA